MDLKRFWTSYKSTMQKFGNIQTSVIFSLLYFVLIFPVGVIFNLLSDPLFIRKFPVWQSFKNNSSTISQMKEQ